MSNLSIQGNPADFGGIKNGTFSTIASAMAHPKGNPEQFTRKSSNNKQCTRPRPRISAAP
jgi:hypothetical protein